MHSTTHTLKAFIAFIFAQPAEQMIFHSFWNRCAVGDYAAGEADRDDPEFADACRDLALDLAREEASLLIPPHNDSTMDREGTLIHHLNYGWGT